MTRHDRSLSHTVRLGSGGRVVIPAEMRAAMGWSPDEPLRLRRVDGEVRIESVADGIRRAQALVREAFGPSDGRSMVDEFIAERRAEARREEEEMNGIPHCRHGFE